MELRELMFLHKASSGDEDDGNLFDINDLIGKPGVTVNGDSITGTARDLNSAGDILLKKTIPYGKSIKISGYWYTEGNVSTVSNIGITIDYKRTDVQNRYKTVTSAACTQLTEKKFSGTKAVVTDTNYIRFNLSSTPDNIWHIRDLKVELVNS